MRKLMVIGVLLAAGLGVQGQAYYDNYPHTEICEVERADTIDYGRVYRLSLTTSQKQQLQKQFTNNAKPFGTCYQLLVLGYDKDPDVLFVVHKQTGQLITDIIVVYGYGFKKGSRLIVLSKTRPKRSDLLSGKPNKEYYELRDGKLHLVDPANPINSVSAVHKEFKGTGTGIHRNNLGLVVQKGRFSGGKLISGKWYRYDENGVLLSIETYDMGKLITSE